MITHASPVLPVAALTPKDILQNAEEHITRSLLLSQDNQPVHALAQLRAAEGFLRTYVETEAGKP